MHSISDFILAVDTQLQKSSGKLTNKSQELIGNVVTTTAKKLLNTKFHKDKYVIGDLVYITDMIIWQNTQLCYISTFNISG